MPSHLEVLHRLSHGFDLVVCFSKLSFCIVYVFKGCDHARDMSTFMSMT